MIFKRILIITLVCVLLPVTGFSTIKISGYFIAGDTCPAVQSIKKGTNPGNINVTKGMAYTTIGKNKPNATHYLIKVEGANPVQRWVPVTCGKLIIDCTEISSGPILGAQPGVQPGGTNQPDYLLAVSWQPAFCETHRSKPECGEEDTGAYEATHFTLHGLWPQPRGNVYCGVSAKNRQLDKIGAWSQLPPLNLSEQTQFALREVMPGVASYLQRHEWYKHGVCYGEPADLYYMDAIFLLYQLNDSAVQEFFAQNIGKSVTNEEICKKFDEAFGAGAGSKIQVKCRNSGNKSMVVELYINLKGTIEPNTPLDILLKNAKNNKKGCDNVFIDKIGFDN